MTQHNLQKEEKQKISCIIETARKKNGWMFWASFAGSEKGSSQF